MFTAQKRYGRDPSIVVHTTTWKDPLRWQRAAAKDNRREFIFTCSWSDWFHQAADDWRSEAWNVIRGCPNLIFQILTKRPERIEAHLPHDWENGYQNVWLGTSIESNSYLWRADILRNIPAAIRFISAEPLLEALPKLNLAGIQWLIVGGEAGPGFRPMNHAWARELRDLATNAGVAFFFKQSSAHRTEMGTYLDGRQWKEFPDIVTLPHQRLPLPFQETT
jgi:protein gp37